MLRVMACTAANLADSWNFVRVQYDNLNCVSAAFSGHPNVCVLDVRQPRSEESQRERRG